MNYESFEAKLPSGVTKRLFYKQVYVLCNEGLAWDKDKGRLVPTGKAGVIVDYFNSKDELDKFLSWS